MSWMFRLVRSTDSKGKTFDHPAGITLSEAKAMMSAVFNVFDHWDLSDDEARTLLGSPSIWTFQRWKNKKAVSVPTDTVWRLRDILGIHKALRYTFPDSGRRYEWVKRPNARFFDKSALEIMLTGPPATLSKVRDYLDAERGASYL